MPPYLAIGKTCFFHVNPLRKVYEKILLLTSVIYRGITKGLTCPSQIKIVACGYVCCALAGG